METALRRILLGGLLLFATLGIVSVLCAALLEPLYMVDVVFDDAYYYLQVAYNIAHGAGSTFDGITKTNGYQPLWMAIVVAIEFVFRFDKTFFVTAVVLVSYAVAGASVLYTRFRFERMLAIALSLGLLSSYALYSGVWRWGMETVLLAPVLPWFVLISMKEDQRTRDWLTGLLLVYMVSIRLDALSVVVACATVDGWSLYRRQGLAPAVRRAIMYGAPSILFLSAYAAFNIAMFSTPVPVSGLAKALGAPLFSNWGLAVQYLGESKALLALALVLFLVERKTKFYRQDTSLYPLIASFSLAILIQLAYYFSFSGWGAWGWYFYSNALAFALVLARIVYISLNQTSAAQFRWVRTTALLASLVFAIFIPAYSYARDTTKFASDAPFHPENHVFNKRTIRDLQTWLDGSRPITVAMGDRSGALGYWSPENVRVFQTEGLVASVEYLEARQEQLGEEWIMNHIAPDVLMVDRGHVPLMGSPGHEQYVVIEPIQGLVTSDKLMVSCFPPDALEMLIADSPDVVRMLFDMHAKEDCSAENQSEINRVIEEGTVRQFSLPEEY
ncbi:MAG: hypothetical protein AMJ63_05415 [Myxococcales bacterium SG8_38_1]|nr:MAG: hypothetical protein AMJ63_05415 [Myxococcales bacterium SG8_38_1]